MFSNLLNIIEKSTNLLKPIYLLCQQICPTKIALTALFYQTKITKLRLKCIRSTCTVFSYHKETHTIHAIYTESLLSYDPCTLHYVYAHRTREGLLSLFSWLTENIITKTAILPSFIPVSHVTNSENARVPYVWDHIVLVKEHLIKVQNNLTWK